MIIENPGLQTSPLTWALALGLLVGWALTLPLLLRVRGRWEEVVMNLTGLAWLGFGLGVVFRFFILAVDAEVYANPSTKLAERAPAVVDFALTSAGLFWICFVAAALAVRVLPVPRLMRALVSRSEVLAAPSFLSTIALTGCIVASLLPMTPAPLVTPLAVVGSMWVVPATVLWVGAFSGVPTPRLSLVGALTPGLIRLVLSPYREHFFVTALVVLLAAIAAGRRIRLALLIPTCVVLVLSSTIAVGTYRQVIWAGAAPSEALSRVSFGIWEERPFEAPWSENVRRFHSFDSLLLTVDLVPDVFPFSEHNLLLEGLTRGLIPRLIDPAKQQSDAGLRFQTQIWSFDDDPTRDERTASIAPSMPGSLYEAGGMIEVIGGAVLWGLLVAFIDRLKSTLSSPVSAGLHVLWAVQAFAGIERDYSAAFANMLQTLVMFLCVCFVLGRRELARSPSHTDSPSLVGPSGVEVSM